MCVVIDLDVVCLVCLQPSKNMHRIFTADGDDPELQIAQKIAILSELKLDQSNQTLPSKICGKCYQDLKAAWRFRKNCQAAVTIFHTIVKLDGVQSENLPIKELAKQEIKVPHGLQIKRIDIDNNAEEEKATETLILDKTDKEDTTLYEDLESHNYEENEGIETSEFHTDENEMEDLDGRILVEYLTEDGTMDESITKISRQLYARDNTETKQRKKLDGEILELQKKTTCLEKICKPAARGRPRRQNLSQKDEINKNTNVIQTKTIGRIVIDSTNNSNSTNQLEVREVKTRKRKSLSPETKTAKICEICGNSYRYQHALNAHMRRHYNDKQFPCECCDKAFVSSVELRRHMRVHTGQKPYACQYCERRFSDFGSRIKHERTHTGERPYHCVTCGKSFAYPHVLSIHVLTHTGEKRFRCGYCTKGFTKKAYLLSHIAQHHSVSKNFTTANEDTMGSNQSPVKSVNFEQCAYTTELANEPIDEIEYDNDSYQGSDDIIIGHSLIEPKVETVDEVEMQEIVEQSEEYTIKIR